jgi:archaellum component FlaC
MVKFQELKALKEQIVTRENESTVENKKIEEKLSNFENLFTSLEAKIGLLDAENEKAFEKQKKEIEQNFEDLQKEIAELQKQ